MIEKLEVNYASEIRRLNMYKAVYTHQVNKKDEQISLLDPTDVDYLTKRSALEQEKAKYEKLLIEVEQELNYLTSDKAAIIQTIEQLALKWMKPLRHTNSDEDRQIRSIAYKICIDQIVIETGNDWTKKVTVILDEDVHRKLYGDSHTNKFTFNI